MWHLTASKISVSLSFFNWIKNETIFLSYLWINVGNINGNKLFHFKKERLTEILQGVRCHIFWLY